MRTASEDVRAKVDLHVYEVGTGSGRSPFLGVRARGPRAGV